MEKMPMSAETRKGPPKRGLTLERSFLFEREKIDQETRTIELAFSSEAPYARWWGVEILDHSKSAVDLTRLKAGGPLLCDHNARDQIGVIESVRIDADRVGRAVVRFGRSARAEEIFRDVVDGIRQNVSVGYAIDDLVLEAKSGEDETYRVTRWTPYEVSLVSVPADFTVGVGRAADPVQEIKMSVIETPAAPVDVAQSQAKARTAEQKRAAEIIAIGEQFALQGMAAEALRAGEPVDAFRSKVMEKLASRPLPNPTAEVGLSGGEKQRYSVLRALRALVDKDWTNAGFERECHQAILKRAGIAEAPNNGFYVPYEIQQRDMTATTGNAGGYVVATDNLAGSFIDLLRNRAVVAQLGATMMTGLVVTVMIPSRPPPRLPTG